MNFFHLAQIFYWIDESTARIMLQFSLTDEYGSQLLLPDCSGYCLPFAQTLSRRFPQIPYVTAHQKRSITILE